LRIVGAHGAVRDLLRAEGIEDKVEPSTALRPSTKYCAPVL
jgi:hypothetical protein